jgi:hypothetical protein
MIHLRMFLKLLLLISVFGLPLAAADGEKPIDAKAAEILKQMSDYLGNLERFTYVGSNSTDLVLKGNQKITIFAASKVSIKRPNKVRSQRLGEIAKVQMFYDGRTLTIFDQEGKHYAQREISLETDGLLDFIRDSFEMEIPAADLFYQDVYEGLMDTAESGRYIGETDIDGVPCHHLAFQADEVDWQLWVETGNRPVPVRYSVTSKWTTSSPVSSVQFSEWDLSPKFPDSVFQFQAPPGAKRVKLASEDGS